MTGDTIDIPPLAGVHEVAAILGVSRQRVSQLVREHPLFPAPVSQLGCGPIWLMGDIVEFAKIPRRPGRPPKRRDLAHR